MGFLPNLKPKKTLSELEEENQELDAEYSNIQKRVAIKQLKERGLKKSNFPNWSSVFQWLKTH